jgi:hypothetical protein
MKVKAVKYGPGGHDPSKPNNNVIEDSLVEVEGVKVSRRNLYLTLSKEGHYLKFITSKNQLTEAERIHVEHSATLSSDDAAVRRLFFEGLKLSEAELNRLFSEALKINN